MVICVAVMPGADAVLVPPFELPPPQADTIITRTTSGVPHDLEIRRIEEETISYLHRVPKRFNTCPPGAVHR